MSIDPAKPRVYVVWWTYHDKSGMDFVCAFDYRDKADAFTAMLNKHCDGGGKQFNCTPVEIEREYP